MAETTLTVRQIMDLGLWQKVCDYKDWNQYILADGKIDENELVTFDSEFKKVSDPLDINHELAEFLHTELCNHNHTDGCGWFYEGNDWEGYAHKKYLEKANKILETEVCIEDIKKIIKITTGY